MRQAYAYAEDLLLLRSLQWQRTEDFHTYIMFPGDADYKSVEALYDRLLFFQWHIDLIKAAVMETDDVQTAWLLLCLLK